MSHWWLHPEGGRGYDLLLALHLRHQRQAGSIWPPCHGKPAIVRPRTHALLRCWQDDFSGARTELAVARGWLQSCDANIWVNASPLGSRPLAWAQQDWNAAEAALKEMTELAGNAEHEQLESLGHMLACQVFEQQGKHESAHREVKLLSRRRQRIRAECIKRDAVVSWQRSAQERAEPSAPWAPVEAVRTLVTLRRTDRNRQPSLLRATAV